MNGLNHWFESKFEKLGLMALAKEHGNDLKVRSYLQSINHLKKCLSDKILSVHDLDRKDDLKIMLDHTETLSIAANKLLESGLGKCSNNKKHNMTDAQETTFYGLHKWEMKMFENLGWMVLSNNEGNSLKIKFYFHSIDILKESLHKKMNDVQEKDRKDDLKILYDDVCILWRAADKLFGNPEGMDSMRYSSSMRSSMRSSIRSSIRSSKKSEKAFSKNSSKKSKKSSKKSGSIFGGLF